MLNYKYIPPKNRNLLTKINIYIINFLILLNLISINISYTDFDIDHIITFDHKKFKAGNFATNKNGELFIEYYSEDDNTRLFYGRQKNGLELFSEQSSSTQEINIGLEKIIDVFGYNYFDIYNSKNLFVTIRNDFNKENQYLFSINSYDYIVELHKFTNNINTDLYLWNLNDFFDLIENEYEFPYETILFELKKELSYIIAFIPKNLVKEEMEELSFIKKFRFKTFNEDAYDEITTIKYSDYINKRILSTFLMDDKYLVVISLEDINEDEFNQNNQYIEDDSQDDNQDNLTNRRRTTGYSFFKITFNFYRNKHDIFEHISNNNNILQVYVNFIDYLFFKAIYLKKDFVVFAYIAYIPEISEDLFLIFKLYELNYLYGGYKRAPKINIHIGIDIVQIKN